MNKKGLEIERKFLIRYPDISFLEALPNCTKADIEQTYTKNDIRLRKWTENNKTAYIKTVKEKISNMVRFEEEEEISKSEYERLLTDADTKRQTIKKTRYRYPFKEKIIEIDIFPFWNDRAYLEVELSSVNEKIHLPDFIKVIREVTNDSRYNNSSLALEIPYDKI